MDASPLLWSSASRAESNWRELSKMFLTTSFVLLMLQLFVCWCCGPGNSVKNYERDLVWLYWASMTVLSLFDALQSLYRLSLISLFSYLLQHCKVTTNYCLLCTDIISILANWCWFQRKSIFPLFQWWLYFISASVSISRSLSSLSFA